MSVKFLKPKEGLEVYIPSKGGCIAAEGENVVVDAYIEGRIKCGSLVEVVEEKKPTKQTKKENEE